MSASSTHFYDLLKKSYRLFKLFLTGDKRLLAWRGLAILISLVFSQVFLNVLLVNWYKRFFDALQNIDKSAFLKELSFVIWLACAYICLAASQLFISQRYLLYWRRWMTNKFLNKWLGDYSFYGLKLIKKEVDNPDQRISQDISEFTQIILTLSLDIIRSLTTLLTFTIVLWHLSYVFSIKIFGHSVKIYGSFVWVALLYSVVGTYFTKYIGAPLAALLSTQEKKEANFRFSLIRVREHAEPISFYKAIAFEKKFY